MKKLLFLIIILIFNSCKNNAEKNITSGYIITGNIENSFNNKIAYLKTQEKGILILLDSTTIKNGKFEFKGSINKPAVYGIFIDSSKGAIGIFMENQAITIDVNKDSLSLSKILGSKTNDEYLSFINQSNQIISKMNDLFPEFQKARAENDAKKLEEINSKMQTINDENSAFALNYAKEHPNSYIGAIALHSILSIPSMSKDTVLKVYSNFSDYVKKGDFALEIKDFLESSEKIDSIQN